MSTDNPNLAGTTMDRRIEKNRRKPWLIGGAVSVVVVAGLAMLLQDAGQTSFTLDGQRIRIATVAEGSFEDFIPLRASVEPERSVYLDAIEGGRVEQVLVEEGALVTEGQPLLELSNTTLQLDVISREAQVSEQLNNLRNTELAIEQNRLRLKSDLIEIDYQIARLERLVNRYEELEGQQFISRNEYEDATDELEYWRSRREVTRESQEQDEKIRLAQIDQLRSSVEQLEKNLVLARANLDNLLVRAPRSGRLTSLEAELGESKARGERLGQIDDVDRFKATARVNEFYLGRVRNGLRAQLEIGREVYELEITKVYPEVEASQFEVDLRFVDRTPQNIRRGQTLQMRLVLGDAASEALLVENGPFFNDTGGAWMFVLDASGVQATRREVELGRRNPNQVEVIAGLLPGDQVIVSSYSNFISVDRILIEQ